jgi:hypothetical protein
MKKIDLVQKIMPDDLPKLDSLPSPSKNHQLGTKVPTNPPKTPPKKHHSRCGTVVQFLQCTRSPVEMQRMIINRLPKSPEGRL